MTKLKTRPDAMLTEVASLVYEPVASSVKKVYKQESLWTQPEMVRRIARYIRNAADVKDMDKMQWKEVIEKFLDGVMHSYSGSCQDRSWFLDLDLTDVLISAVQVILRPFKEGTPQGDELSKVVKRMWYIRVEEARHDKVMWISVQNIFPSKDKAREKIFTSLKKTYPVALDSVLQNTQTLDDGDRLHLFLRRWIEDFMSRSWSAVQDPERILSEEAVVHLFQKLMFPFGVLDPFCCIPPILTKNTGRPPEIGNFIRSTICTLLRSWQMTEGSGNARKRRKLTEQSRTGWTVQHTSQSDSVKVSVMKTTEKKDEVDDSSSEAAADTEPEGHPECFSQDECRGSASDEMIRHILDGKPKDIYCRTCWIRFLTQNPYLQGRPLREEATESGCLETSQYGRLRRRGDMCRC